MLIPLRGSGDSRDTAAGCPWASTAFNSTRKQGWSLHSTSRGLSANSRWSTWLKDQLVAMKRTNRNDRLIFVIIPPLVSAPHLHPVIRGWCGSGFGPLFPGEISQQRLPQLQFV